MKRFLTRREFMKYAGAGVLGAAAAVTLGACSSGSSETTAAETAEASAAETTAADDDVAAVGIDESGRVTDVIQAHTSELTSFIPAYGGQPDWPANFVDTLLLVDAHNRVQPGLAETWSCNDDETVWTFHMREGATWVDYEGNYKGDVVSEDFVYGLEWVLNFWKNDSYNTTVPIQVIEGAEDYYFYTQSLTEDEAMSLDIDTFLDMVGIETPDDYTVIYKCLKSCPYFETMVTAQFASPISKGQFDEIGASGYKGVTPTQLWYCGPYVMSEYVEGNTKTLTPNPSYWNRDNTLRFDSFTILITESTDTAWELFDLGTINDIQELSSAQSDIINNDVTNPWHENLVLKPSFGTMFGFYFNFAKKKIDDDSMDTDWNKAAANENFRKCFYYGMDLYNYYATRDAVDPESCAACCMSAYGIAKLSDGTDYTSLVKDLIGFDSDVNWSHQDTDQLEECKAAAREELAAEGVTFPIHMDLWASSAQSSMNTYTVLQESIEDALGTDLVEVEVHTYISSKMSEVYNPGYLSMEVQGYGPEYCDPMTYLTQLCNDMAGNAEYADMYGHIGECTEDAVLDQMNEYTQMVREADAITGDHDARLRALAEAEAYAINHVLVFPAAVNSFRVVTLLNLYTVPCTINDNQSKRMINVESKIGYYTKDEYDQIRAAYLAES